MSDEARRLWEHLGRPEDALGQIELALRAVRDEERDLIRDFWANVRVTDGCWEWTGPNDGKYGRFYRGGQSNRAHRLSYELFVGEIPDGLWVLHHCDNPPCIRPDHLFLGDCQANMRDAAQKGRICTIGQSLKTHCKRGHEFTPENTYVDTKGHRRCRTCATERRKAIRATREPVPPKTHCKHGHEFTEENTAYRGGKRSCRACDRERWHRRKPAIREGE